MEGFEPITGLLSLRLCHAVRLPCKTFSGPPESTEIIAASYSNNTNVTHL